MERRERLFLVAVLVCALIFAAATLEHLRTALPGPGHSTVGADSVAGQPRDVDLDAVRRMIRRGELSDHEAAYYTTEAEF